MILRTSYTILLLILAIFSVTGCTTKPLHIAPELSERARDLCLHVVSSDGVTSTATLLNKNIAITTQHAIEWSGEQTKLSSYFRGGTFTPTILAIGPPLHFRALYDDVYSDQKTIYENTENDWAILELPPTDRFKYRNKPSRPAKIGQASAGDIIFIGGIVVPDSIDYTKPIPGTPEEFWKDAFRLSQGKITSINGVVLTFQHIAGDEIIGGMSGGPIMKLSSDGSDLILVGIMVATHTKNLIFKNQLGRVIPDLQDILD